MYVNLLLKKNKTVISYDFYMIHVIMIVWASVLLKHQQNIVGKNIKFEGENIFGFGITT